MARSKFIIKASLVDEYVEDLFFSNRYSVAEVIQFAFNHGVDYWDEDESLNSDHLDSVVGICGNYAVTYDPYEHMFDIFECIRPFNFR
jgi:hypothetical protein